MPQNNLIYVIIVFLFLMSSIMFYLAFKNYYTGISFKHLHNSDMESSDEFLQIKHDQIAD